MAGYWNHNVYYQPLILAAVPPGCGSALDVGCGDGLLACQLAEHCRDVTGVDRDHHMISLARERARDQLNVAFIDAEFPAFPFEDATFDFITSNTALHQMNFEAALMAMTRLLRPGGRLAIVGLARNASARDYAPDLMGLPLNLGLDLTHAALRTVGREDRSPSFPIKDPVMTWDEVRIGALRLLPGAQYRRHLLWRYSLQWRKPG